MSPIIVNAGVNEVVVIAYSADYGLLGGAMGCPSPAHILTQLFTARKVPAVLFANVKESHRRTSGRPDYALQENSSSISSYSYY